MDLAQRHHRFRRPWNFADVVALFSSRGCTLLEQQYTGTKQVMRYLCPAGHEYAQRFDHFVGGHGCPRCRSHRRWAGRRIDLNEVLLLVEDEGFTDVRVHRTAGRIRIGYTCTAGHLASTGYGHFLNGRRCRRCLGLRQRGPGSPNYNHDLTDEDRAIGRKNDEYAAWRLAVFQRDDFICRRCSAGGRINAHHIVNYSTARDLRTVVANGITLCAPCHRGFHAEHGYRNNNADQLSSFLGAAWV